MERKQSDRMCTNAICSDSVVHKMMTFPPKLRAYERTLLLLDRIIDIGLSRLHFQHGRAIQHL